MAIHKLFPEVEVPKVDPVFFRKDQITVGTTLINVGRKNSLRPRVWIVTKIWTYNLYKGQYKSHRVMTVNKLSDAIELRPDEPIHRREFLELSFSYLSYSAIWRIVP